MADNNPQRIPFVRRGQGDTTLSREEFAKRFREQFYDPAFDPLNAEIDRLTQVAWDGYEQGRKSPRTRGGLSRAAHLRLLPQRHDLPGRYIGYYEKYATSHEALDVDQGLQAEVANAARALANQVKLMRAGRREPDEGLRDPRPK